MVCVMSRDWPLAGQGIERRALQLHADMAVVFEHAVGDVPANIPNRLIARLRLCQFRYRVVPQVVEPQLRQSRRLSDFHRRRCYILRESIENSCQIPRSSRYAPEPAVNGRAGVAEPMRASLYN